MSTLIGKIKAFLLWNKAASLCNNELYDQAKEVLYDLYISLGIEPFSARMMPIVSLRFAYILQKCDLIDDSSRACAASIEYLDADRQKKERKYGDDEGRYLYLYAKYILQYNKSTDSQDEINDLRRLYQDINLNKVSTQVKNMFPLDHNFLSR